MTEKWVLVPVEPTREMVLAGDGENHNSAPTGFIKDIWAAMLEVAPEQPTNELLISQQISTHDAVQQEREACLAIVEAPHWKPIVRQVLKHRADEIRERNAL